MQAKTAQIPFNQFLGLEAATEEGRLLRLPSSGQYLNHLGTVHASAQLALAEASSGEFLLRAVGSAEGVVPVVRRVEAKFRKPAQGALVSSVSTPTAAVERLLGELAAKGRAVISVAVEVHDESGAHTLSAKVEWFIARVGETTGAE